MAFKKKRKWNCCVYFVSLVLLRVEFWTTTKCVICLHKIHLNSKCERHYSNCLTHSIHTYDIVCLRHVLCTRCCVCMRSPRVICDFCFIAFVYSTHYLPYAVFYLYCPFIFHELKNTLSVIPKRRRRRRSEKQRKNQPNEGATKPTNTYARTQRWRQVLLNVVYMHKCLSHACN